MTLRLCLVATLTGDVFCDFDMWFASLKPAEAVVTGLALLGGAALGGAIMGIALHWVLDR